MSEANTNKATDRRPNLDQPNEIETSSQVAPTKVSLWEAIIRGWEWVVFTWRMLQRLGGFGAMVRTLFFIFSLLIKRMLIQWGVIQKK